MSGLRPASLSALVVVHNEEHGAVVIWWGPKVPASTVAKLQAFYNEPVKGYEAGSPGPC